MSKAIVKATTVSAMVLHAATVGDKRVRLPPSSVPGESLAG